MNTAPKNDWNRHLNFDSAANAGVLAAGLFIILFAAATALTDPAPQATQSVRQDWDGRIDVTAIPSSTEKAGVPPAEYGDSVQLAASSPVAPVTFNQHDLDGDNHAK